MIPVIHYATMKMKAAPRFEHLQQSLVSSIFPAITGLIKVKRKKNMNEENGMISIIDFVNADNGFGEPAFFHSPM